MIRHIKKQIEGNKTLNLLFKSLSDIVNIDKDFKEYILYLKKNKIEIPDQLITDTINSTLESIYAVNQFIDVDEHGLKRLNELYRNTYLMIDEENFNKTLEKHFADLSAIISSYYPENFRTGLAHIKEIGFVINEQYSADFQLELYDLSIDDLDEPIIDIGCGSKAQLVNMLQSEGKDVFGIDRIVSQHTEKIMQKSWFDFNFRPESWGTIYSNMSFSNHFIYTLKNDKSKILTYLQKYQELLKALKENGEFIYAPSLPEVETTIDIHQYEIVRKNKTNGITITKVRKIAI